MTKTQRQQVYQKYNGHCAYCGKEIALENMQVDHVFPKHMCIGVHKGKLKNMDNMLPSCRRCNHYKRAPTLEQFRESMLTLHKRVRNIYICKVAEDYGIITVGPWDGIFYFEGTGRLCTK